VQLCHVATVRGAGDWEQNILRPKKEKRHYSSSKQKGRGIVSRTTLLVRKILEFSTGGAKTPSASSGRQAKTMKQDSKKKRQSVAD